MPGVRELGTKSVAATRNRVSNQDRWLLKQFEETLGYEQSSSREEYSSPLC